MIIVADSGSTKTTWKILENGKEKTVRTTGINPYYQSQKEIEEALQKELLPKIGPSETVKEIFFYGAGLGNEQRKKDLSIPLHFLFRNAEIEVDHDLMGAARALLGNKEGIACIAGTGSNSCLYNGKNIVQNVDSLGLYMGDEGSGGYKGKALIIDYLRDNLPENIRRKFEDTFTDRKDQIMEKVYKKPFPNRYLASYMPFISDNKKDSYISELIRKSFSSLFENCISHYPGWEKIKVSFTGSVAAHLEKQLKEVAKEKGFRIGVILADPLEALTDFHFNNRKS